MLLGERLCRRHQGGLEAVLDGSKHRVERNHSLSRSHLAHQQSLHRTPLGEITVELIDRPPLIRGELKRKQRLDPPRREPALTGKRWRHRVSGSDRAPA